MSWALFRSVLGHVFPSFLSEREYMPWLDIGIIMFIFRLLAQLSDYTILYIFLVPLSKENLLH